MNDQETKELAELLEQVLSKITVQERQGAGRMDLNQYRTLLMAANNATNPYADVLASRYELDMPEALRESLHNSVRTSLTQYIDGDSIQTANIAMGTAIYPGFPMKMMIDHLMKVAIKRGAQYAAINLQRYVSGKPAEYRKITLISGIQVDRPIEVANGVTIEPLPKASNELPEHLPPMTGLGGPQIGDLIGGTTLVEKLSVSPAFINPVELQKQDDSPNDWNKAFKRNASNEYDNFSVDRFCDALSLAAHCAAQNAAQWAHADADETFLIMPINRGSSFRPLALIHGGNNEVTENDVQKALSLYTDREKLNSKDAAKLNVAVERWIKSKTESNPVDKAIDLGIALETLYINDTGPELGFRLAFRAAWHLGKDGETREFLIKKLRDIYNLRSTAVHQGTVNQSSTQMDLLDEAQSLCRKAIIKIIRDGKFPNWDKLITGQELR